MNRKLYTHTEVDYGLNRRRKFTYQPAKKNYRKWLGVSLVALISGLILEANLNNDGLQPAQVALNPTVDIQIKESQGSAPTVAAIAPEVIAPAPAPKLLPKERTITVAVKPGDTLGKIFEKQGLDTDLLHDLIENETVNHTLANIHPGQKIDLTIGPKNDLLELEYNANELERLEVTVKEGKPYATIVERDVEELLTFADVTIDDSLFMAGEREGLDYNITTELANIFGWAIDFALDIQKGDKFSVIYEDRYVDGEKVTPGDIIAAEFVNQGKTYRAVRYEDANGKADYYTPEGQRMHKRFLRTPVEFARVSSKFNPHRRHPILHTIRAHNGVDYAAPIGTPVRATGDGVITTAGTKGGYGKVVEIQHGSNYSTLYAHLNGFATSIRKGTEVKQGQIIGYVGKTGMATGPHLHYEFRVNNVHKDPQTVALPNSEPINPRLKTQFLAHVSDVLKQLSDYQSVQLAAAKLPNTPKQGA